MKMVTLGVVMMAIIKENWLNIDQWIYKAW